MHESPSCCMPVSSSTRGGQLKRLDPSLGLLLSSHNASGAAGTFVFEEQVLTWGACLQVMANLTSAMASSDLGQLAQAIAGAQDWTSRRFPKDAEAAPVRSPVPRPDSPLWE